MKKCVIISNYVVNKYRESILKEKIEFFKSLEIDVLLVSSDHIKKYDNVDHYITLNTKNCVDKYLSNNLHLYTCINDKTFWYRFPNSDLHYKYSLETYFLKMFEVTINHCNLVGYDFVIFMEFDIVFHDNKFIEDVCKNADYTKYYFYKVANKADNNSYHSLFFYGNVSELINIFNDKNYKILSVLSKNENVWSVENAIWMLINRSEFNSSKTNFMENLYLDQLSYVNLFTSNNIVDVFYQHSNKKYYFLHSKNWNDNNQNSIGAELYKDGELLYSNVLKIDSSYYWCELENNKNYTIKKYDGDICEEKLYTIKKTFTDSNKQTTAYFCN